MRKVTGKRRRARIYGFARGNRICGFTSDKGIRAIGVFKEIRESGNLVFREIGAIREIRAHKVHVVPDLKVFRGIGRSGFSGIPGRTWIRR